VHESFTDYLSRISFNECVASHNERITHGNRHTILCDSHDREARPIMLKINNYSVCLFEVNSESRSFVFVKLSSHAKIFVQ